MTIDDSILRAFYTAERMGRRDVKNLSLGLVPWLGRTAFAEYDELPDCHLRGPVSLILLYMNIKLGLTENIIYLILSLRLLGKCAWRERFI